jgi:hypothetical protein
VNIRANSTSAAIDIAGVAARLNDNAANDESAVPIEAGEVAGDLQSGDGEIE